MSGLRKGRRYNVLVGDDTDFEDYDDAEYVGVNADGCYLFMVGDEQLVLPRGGEWEVFG